MGTIKIGIVYSTYFRNISNDDKVLIKVIEKKPNLEYLIFNWDQDNSIDIIQNNQFQFLLIRNTWTTNHNESFQDWLEKVKNSSNILILNDFEMVKWNFSKIYLKELRDHHLVNIIPTVFIKKNSIINDITPIIKQAVSDGIFTSDSNKFVYKPAIGADGFGVGSFTTNDINNISTNNSSTNNNNNNNNPSTNNNSNNQNHYLIEINQLLKNNDVLIQPFLKSIIDEGEYSFIFFNSRFSHSAIKRPNKNEFKVQNGSLELITPNSFDLDVAKSISNKLLKIFKAPILYTRIDMIRYNNKLCLNELDLTEPNLYFLGDENLANNFLDRALDIYTNYQINQNKIINPQNKNKNTNYYINK